MKKLITLLFVLGLFQLSAQTSIYIKGTGHNYPDLRIVKMGSNYLVNGSGRGLCLTIINASTHQHISSIVYDTYGYSTASDNLATALNNLKRSQIGILTSYDAWENNVTTSLQNAARRLGLYKLGSGLSSGARRPYAAIFRGSGTTGNTTPNHIAYEVMQSRDSNAERAVIATWLIEDAFVGNNLTNALVSGDGDNVGASLLVNHLGYVGIGTTTPDTKLTVKGNIHTQEVKVDLNGAVAPDYVFKDGYNLRSLEEVKEYIQEHGHLPNIPSAKEMETNGIQLKAMNLKLLEKIEEQMLYILELEERIEKQKEFNKTLLKRLEKLEKQ